MYAASDFSSADDSGRSSEARLRWLNFLLRRLRRMFRMRLNAAAIDSKSGDVAELFDRLRPGDRIHNIVRTRASTAFTTSYANPS